MQRPSSPPSLGCRYRELELLGEGGTATAWRARDVARGSMLVVVKVFRAESTTAALEFATLSQLDHPNLVKAHDLGVTEEGCPYVVVSNIDGPDLRVWSDVEGGRSVTELSTAMSSLCRALACIHSRGVLHCDLKPENVILQDGAPDRLQLIDFGLSHRESSSHRTSCTSGTLPYMAPELLQGGAPTVRADLYSLGVILHELTTGQLPDTPSFGEWSKLVRKGCTEPDRFEPLTALIEALLSPSPEDRPRNAIEVIILLGEATGLDLSLSPSHMSGSHFPTPRILGSGHRALGELTERLNKVTSSHGDDRCFVLLEGPEDSGKSRIASETMCHAKLLGCTVFEHRHHAPDMGEPIFSLRSELEASFVARGKSLEVSGSPLGEVADSLLEVASRGPVLVVIDGLESQHTLTIDFLHYLLYRLSNTMEVMPLSFLITTRDDQLRASNRLADLGEAHRSDTIHLDPLDTNDIAQLIGEVVPGYALDEHFGTRLAERSRGLPGVALAHLRTLYKRGLLPPRAGRWPSDMVGHLDDSNHKEEETPALKLIRSPSFPLPVRSALWALALLESPSPWSIWQASLGAEVALDDIDIDDLEQTGCIYKTVKDGEPQYSIVSTQLAEELLQSCDIRSRRTFHERLLVALDAQSSDVTPRGDVFLERLARHHAGCGHTEEAALLLVEAARTCRLAHDFSKAERLIEKALSLRSAQGELVGLERIEVLRASGQLSAALEALEGLERPRSVLIGAELLIDLGRYDDALTRLDAAGDDAHPSSFSASCMTLKARALERLGRVDEAAETCREALEQLSGEESDPLVCGELHHVAGLCAYSQTSYEFAAKELELALDYFQRADNATVSIIRVRNAQAMVRSQLGDLSGAAAEYGRCLAMARRLHDPKLESTYRMNQATISQLQGEHEASIKGYRSAIDLSEALGLVRLQARARANLGTLLTHFGSLGPARRQLDPALSLTRAHGFKDIEALVAATLAEVALLQEDWEHCEVALDDAAECCSDPVSAIEIALLRSRFARTTRHWSDGIDHAHEALKLSEHHDQAVTIAQARLQLGIIELERGGDHVTAREHLDAALLSAGQLELSEVEWQAHYFMFKLDREAGEEVSSRHHATQAQELLERSITTIPPGYRKAYSSVRDRREALKELDRAKRFELNDRPEAQGERVRAYRQLLEITRELVSERAVEPLLARILDRAIELTGAERAFVLLKQEENLDVVATHHMDAAKVRECTDMVSRSIAEEVIRTDRPILTVDAAEDERFDRSRSVQNLQLRSILCVPLRMKGEILGALYLDNHLRTDAFADEDRELVGAFANGVSLAIHNAQLHEAAEDQRLELEEKTLQIEAQRRELAQLVEKRTQELEEASVRLRHHTDELVRRYEKHNLIGASKPMREVFSQVDRVADSDISVLIFGESGTGKELIARSIHAGSSRARKAFVALNCAAIPGTLLESELFGHVKGAFTGATRDKPGLFEIAHDGTLFLDEIGDMDASLQAKLLRVLQEGTFRRIGEERERKSNARVISASHHDVSSLIKEGLFREDLYYRLNVVQLDLPPLRGRREDIPSLVDHFLRLHGGSRPKRQLRRDAMELLLDYSWPGNVRELENEIHRAVVLSGSEITPDSLSVKVRMRHEGLRQGRPVGLLREAVADLERQMITDALTQTDGVVSRAARLLGLDRVVLYRKIKRLGIKR